MRAKQIFSTQNECHNKKSKAIPMKICPTANKSAVYHIMTFILVSDYLGLANVAPDILYLVLKW